MDLKKKNLPTHKYYQRYKKNCQCRKPGTKLFSLLKKKWPIITNQVFMLGDKKLDYHFAKKTIFTLSIQKKIYLNK